MGWDKGDLYEMELLKQQKPLTLPKPTPVLDKEWDEEANQYVETIGPGPLTRHFSQGDPGDERD